MHQGRLTALVGVVTLSSLAGGCLPSIADLDDGPLTSTFAVSDFFSPSGYMGDGMFFGKLSGTPNVDCAPRAGMARGSCYHFKYLPNDVDVDAWAGVFWVFPSNSWGASSGHAIESTKFKQISFWAAVRFDSDKPYTVDGNSVPFQGQAGGIDPLGRYSSKGQLDYVDGVNVKQGWNIGAADGPGPQMKQFHIPIDDFARYAGCQNPATARLISQGGTGKAPNCTGGEAEFMAATAQATYLIGAFAWALHYPTDTVDCADGTTSCRSGLHSSQYRNAKPVHIYLDDIVWDTQDPPAP